MEILETKVTRLEEREKGLEIFGKVAGEIRPQGGRALVWHPKIKQAILMALSRGIEATSIRRTIVFVASALNIAETRVPSQACITTWRSMDLPVLLHDQLRKFVIDADELSLAMDCSAVKDHKISGLGLINQDQQYLLLDLCSSLNTTANQLFSQICRRLQQSGLEDIILPKIVDIITGLPLSKKLPKTIA